MCDSIQFVSVLKSQSEMVRTDWFLQNNILTHLIVSNFCGFQFFKIDLQFLFKST